ncbi:uncharacterized protein BDW70DRAFT_56546 [Aspergillus foveolatus]|uniref:uncharacterized protein n=1 Tax=Aspergillus foveolatus TaxID=210207 RepID=UPI003CCE1601
MFAVLPNPWGQFIQELDVSVQSTNPKPTLLVWRTATARALTHMTMDERKASIASLVDHIEGKTSVGSSSGTESRRQQLQAFIQRCALLKDFLRQDPDEFVFLTSQPGTEYSEKAMVNTNGEGESGDSVRLRLWPALHRRTTGRDIP